MPRRSSEEVPAPLRQWCKAPTELRRDPAYYRLKPEQKAAYWDLLLWSLESSYLPGAFLDESGEALEPDEIAHKASATATGAAVLVQAIPELRRSGLLEHSRDLGLFIPRYVERHCAKDEIYKVERRREQVRDRKRKSRALAAQAGAPVPLRAVDEGR